MTSHRGTQDNILGRCRGGGISVPRRKGGVTREPRATQRPQETGQSRACAVGRAVATDSIVVAMGADAGLLSFERSMVAGGVGAETESDHSF